MSLGVSVPFCPGTGTWEMVSVPAIPFSVLIRMLSRPACHRIFIIERTKFRYEVIVLDIILVLLLGDFLLFLSFLLL